MLEFMRPETLSGGHDPTQLQHSLQAKYRGGLWFNASLRTGCCGHVTCIRTAHRPSSFCVLQSMEGLVFLLVEPCVTPVVSFPVAEAAAMEQHSLHSVYQLVVMCCECVALWRVLCEGNMNLTAGKLGVVSGKGVRNGEGGKRKGGAFEAKLSCRV